MTERTKRLELRLTPEEVEIFRAAAKKSHDSNVTNWVRRVLLTTATTTTLEEAPTTLPK